MHTTTTHRGRFRLDYAGPPPPPTADAAAATPAPPPPPTAANLATLPSGLDPTSIPVVDDESQAFHQASPATFQGLSELQAILDGDTPDYDFGNMHAFLASATPEETWFDGLNE